MIQNVSKCAHLIFNMDLRKGHHRKNSEVQKLY
jgi:hypothetical protein